MKKSILYFFLFIFINQVSLNAAPPEWEVSASQFEFAMTITSEVIIDGFPAAGADDVLGAFAGEELRGVANAVHEVTQDRYIFFLTVFSNQSNGEDISFRYYSSETDQVVQLWSTVAFQNGDNLGNISEPWSILDAEPEITCTVTFEVYGPDSQSVTDATLVFNGEALEAGQYVIEELVAGTYTYSVSKDGYITYDGEVIVPEDTEELLVTVNLEFIPDAPDTYQVVFSVTDLNGLQIENVLLSFNGNEETQSLVISELEPGIYPYIISKAGYNDRSGNVTVFSADVHLEIILLENDLGWENVSLPQFRMFPNPASDYFSIEVDNQSLVERVQIFDAGGRQIREITGEEALTRIDISMLCPGLYFVTITGIQSDPVVRKLTKY